ncbi:hypothetical protein AVEN_103261-1 [Araneus ventricosus]|uniref:Uncharacterized protein n=1 Tax=Araneus ventricosus TaxID=182803 RepID=A0A4Y2KNC6_ARAVE|nr:hypothetical protein AVEN_103261-1 [Araneus ventricosus]
MRFEAKNNDFNVRHFHPQNHLLRLDPLGTGDTNDHVTICPVFSSGNVYPRWVEWKGTIMAETGARESLILTNRALILTLHKCGWMMGSHDRRRGSQGTNLLI